MKRTPLACCWLVLVALAVMTGCGGGGGGSSSSSANHSGFLSITTLATLPGTLQGHAYSTTLAARGGTGAYHWSIAPISSTAMFVTGLSIDATTGVISGTANFGGTGGFMATVADSAEQSASQMFFITASSPLTIAATQDVTGTAYVGVLVPLAGLNGGVAPLIFSMDASCLPLGLTSHVRILNTQPQPLDFLVTGTPYATGTFRCVLTVQDSFSPPEMATQALTLRVMPPPLSVAAGSLPLNLRLNRPFAGQVVAVGGVPPYRFALSSGAPPTGIAGPDTTGVISGTPTAAGFYAFTVAATDSSAAPQTVSQDFRITVSAPLGRNDTPATATAIGNGTIQASISPYIDPPNGAPLAGDNDYYKLVSLGGAIVHVETVAARSTPYGMLDSVIEIVDGNGHQLATCRLPGDTSTNFNSPCLNDDIAAGILDSALDYQVPGAGNVANTFYVHVLDWRGDARPDMTYALTVTGITH